LKRVSEMLAFCLGLPREGGHPFVQFLQGHGRKEASVVVLLSRRSATF
jgi:hypothetical protein